MHFIVINATKEILHVTRYIVVGGDEMTTIYNKSWVNVHVHLVDGFKCIHVLLNLERLICGGTTGNMTNVIFNSY
jgi:hypothetical protein